MNVTEKELVDAVSGLAFAVGTALRGLHTQEQLRDLTTRLQASAQLSVAGGKAPTTLENLGARMLLQTLATGKHIEQTQREFYADELAKSKDTSA